MKTCHFFFVPENIIQVRENNVENGRLHIICAKSRYNFIVEYYNFCIMETSGLHFLHEEYLLPSRKSAAML